jgi:hypothetical protein
VGTLYANERGLYLLLPSGSECSQNCKSELADLDNVAGHRPSKRGSDISLPKPSEHLANLRYESLVAFLPFRKVKKFIQTKVAAINCGVLTYC